MEQDIDKILYQNFLNGDEVSFKKIVQKYKDNIIYLVYQYIDDAKIDDEIFQNTVSYLMHHKELYSFSFDVKTHFLMIAKSQTLKYLKENMANSYGQFDDIRIEEYIIEKILSGRENADRIHTIINQLDKECREITNLCILEGMSYEEASKETGKSTKQIKKIVEKSRTKLQKQMKKAEKTPFVMDPLIRNLLIVLLVVSIIFGIVFIKTR